MKDDQTRRVARELAESSRAGNGLLTRVDWCDFLGSVNVEDRSINKGYMMLQGACSSEDQVQGTLGVAIFQCPRGESSHYTVPGMGLIV